MEMDYITMSSDSSSSVSDTDISMQSVRMEDCRIDGVRLQLPQGLCENKDIFKEFFSTKLWQETLTEQQKQHLKNFLPTFPENDSQEKDECIKRLFSKENMRFGSPLSTFHSDLKNGYFRPDIAKMKSLMKKAQYKEYKYQQRRYYFKLMKDILVSRQKLLENAFSQPPGSLVKMERIHQAPPPRVSQVELRARRRYFQELGAVRQEVGESEHSSEDDNYPGPPPRLNKKQKRQLANLECSLSPDMRRMTSTVALKPSGFDLEANVSSNHNPYEVNEEGYRLMLHRHKRRRLERDEHPELITHTITLNDVTQRAQIFKRPPSSNSAGNSNLLRLSNSKKKSTNHSRSSNLPIKQERPPSVHRESSNGSLAIDSEEDEEDTNSHRHSYSYEEEPTDIDVESTTPSISMPVSSVPLQTSPSLPPPPPPAPPQPPPPPLPLHLPVTQKPSATVNKSTSKKSPASRKHRANSNTSNSSSRSSKAIGEKRGKMDSEEDLSKSEKQGIFHTSSHSSASSALLTSNNIATNAESPQNSQTSSTYLTPSRQHIVKPATLSDLDGIDMMNLPVDLEEPNESIKLENIKPGPELMQETHCCFFSLIRDIICTTSNQRMGLLTLEEHLKAWQKNPISPLNDWYYLAPDWVLLLISAVNFLAGDYPDAQPEDYVPYLELKTREQMYQWIGAGRDTDNHLMPLCRHWLDHRDRMKLPLRTGAVSTTANSNNSGIESRAAASAEAALAAASIVDDDALATEFASLEERSHTPPPPRCSTNWVVQASTTQERDQFREQERHRYENPHKAFTFRMHGFESVVGPVKGVYNQSVGMNKARGHSLLVTERPNFVTILALVRDATARLPNGEGTRTEICELLKDSQYLAPVGQESYLHSVVSGALDRLHCEPDPCVKYDTKRKMWIYLHRGRSEEEFERLHIQHQGMTKTKKATNTRPKVQRLTKKQQRQQLQDVMTESTSISTPVSNPKSLLNPKETPTLLNTSSSLVQSPNKIETSGATVSGQPTKTIRTPKSRSITLATTKTTQNIVHNTNASGIQTIQVSSSSTLLTNKITTPITKQVSTSTTSTTVALSGINVAHQNSPQTLIKPANSLGHVTTTTSQGVKTVTLTAQQMQQVAARTLQGTLKSQGATNSTTSNTIRMAGSGLITNVSLASATTSEPREVKAQARIPTSTSVTQRAGSIVTFAQQQSHQNLRPTSAAAKVSGRQLLNVSQVQIRTPQTVMAKQVLTSGGKTLVTTGISGVKLVNAVKAAAANGADGTLTQQQGQPTFYIKQKTTGGTSLVDSSNTVVAGNSSVVTTTTQQQLLQQQHQAKVAAAIAQLQQQYQQHSSGQGQTSLVSGSTSSPVISQQRVVTTVPVLSNQAGQTQRIVTRDIKSNLKNASSKKTPNMMSLINLRNKQIPVSQLTLQSTPSGGVMSTTTLSKSSQSQNLQQNTVSQNQQQPVVAKVLTQGQVISMESLLTQKQQGGNATTTTTMRLPAGATTKAGQSIIQIPTSTPGQVAQFAVVSQGNILSVGQQRVLQTHLQAGVGNVKFKEGLKATVSIPQQAGVSLTQSIAGVTTAKLQATGTKTVSAGTNIRMLGTTSTTTGLNIAHIGGKPVLLASKTQGGQLQATTSTGQNVILASQSGGQTVVLASQALRAQGGALVLQQGGAQQIILPPGFQAGTLNIKTLQGLQGLKVIPLSQTTNAASANAKGRPQVLARIINTNIRPQATAVSSIPVSVPVSTVVKSNSTTIVQENPSTPSDQ